MPPVRRASTLAAAALLLLLVGGGSPRSRPASSDEGAGDEDPKASGFSFARNPRVRHSIPLDRLVKGVARADPKDGIPAIRHPVAVPAAEADFLADDDPVVGVTVGDEARAYALRLLERHEVVNDTLGGVPIAVTYCPLCDSAVVARRDLDVDPARRDETLTLGISGYLFDSDVLLYDAETETFWQQILAEAVVGPLTGRTLVQVPAARATWKAWRDVRPRTTALSWKTEHAWPKGAYGGSAYVEYRATNRLVFPVERRSPAWPPKSEVFGVSWGGRHLAVPEKLLEGRADPVEVEVGGRRFRLVRDAALSTWRGEARREGLDAAAAPAWDPFPWLRCYWFAWYAFHPATETWSPPPEAARR